MPTLTQFATLCRRWDLSFEVVMNAHTTEAVVNADDVPKGWFDESTDWDSQNRYGAGGERFFAYQLESLT